MWPRGCDRCSAELNAFSTCNSIKGNMGNGELLVPAGSTVLVPVPVPCWHQHDLLPTIDQLSRLTTESSRERSSYV